MLSIPLQNLTIALCLTLQVTATACVPCPCPCMDTLMVHGSREAGLRLLSGTSGTSNACCLLCESKAETQHPMRPVSTDRHDRPSSACVQAPILITTGACPVSLAEFGADVLPSPCAYELQVFLE